MSQTTIPETAVCPDCETAAAPELLVECPECGELVCPDCFAGIGCLTCWDGALRAARRSLEERWRHFQQQPGVAAP